MLKSIAIESLPKLPYKVRFLLLRGVYQLCQADGYAGYLILGCSSGTLFHIKEDGELIQKLNASDAKKTGCYVYSQETLDSLKSLTTEDENAGLS